MLHWVDVLLLEAPPNAAGEDSSQENGGEVDDPGQREDEVVELVEPEEADVGLQRVEQVGEVEDQADDGQADAGNGAAEDDVHGQEVLAALAKHLNLEIETVLCNGGAGGCRVALENRP